MKFTIVASAIAALAPLASARNCTPDLDYCGYNILGIGFYNAFVEGALKRAGQPTDATTMGNAIFHCDDDQGNIHYVTTCDNCSDGGTGNSDFC